MSKLPKIALGAWAWGNDTGFDILKTHTVLPNVFSQNRWDECILSNAQLSYVLLLLQGMSK